MISQAIKRQQVPREIVDIRTNGAPKERKPTTLNLSPEGKHIASMIVCFLGLLIYLPAAHSASASTCMPDSFFEITDPDTRLEKPSKEFSIDRKNATKGDSNAQFNMGLYYESGHLVTPCMDKAKFWYGKSAASGNAQAQKMLKTLACIERNFPNGEVVAIFSSDLCDENFHPTLSGSAINSTIEPSSQSTGVGLVSLESAEIVLIQKNATSSVVMSFQPKWKNGSSNKVRVISTIKFFDSSSAEIGMQVGYRDLDPSSASIRSAVLFTFEGKASDAFDQRKLSRATISYEIEGIGSGTQAVNLPIRRVSE